LASAYCPTCFVEDLAAGCVPYFRQDWMAVLATACWKHRTPPRQWQWAPISSACRSTGCFRRHSETYPDFFQAALDRLQALQSVPEADLKSPGLHQALQLLLHVQTLLEKLAASPMTSGQNELVRYSRFGVCLHRRCLLAANYARPESQPLAAYLRPTGWCDWFGPQPPGLGPREYRYHENSFRIRGVVSWRQTGPATLSRFGGFDP
jgi:hypothetical protein